MDEVNTVTGQELAMRVCETCQAGIVEGYVIDDGAYCSLVCGGTWQSAWDAYHEEQGDDAENYWTEWTEEPSPQAELYNAIRHAIGEIEHSVMTDEAIEKMVVNILDRMHD